MRLDQVIHITYLIMLGLFNTLFLLVRYQFMHFSYWFYMKMTKRMGRSNIPINPNQLTQLHIHPK